ncbi:MAG: hypothetical protein V7K43_25535 [Nostoc sp.]
MTINSFYPTDIICHLYILFIYRGINNDVDDTVIISSIGFSGCGASSTLTLWKGSILKLEPSIGFMGITLPETM